MTHFKRIASGVSKLLSCMLAPMVQHNATFSSKSVGMAAVAPALMVVFWLQELGLRIPRWVWKARTATFAQALPAFAAAMAWSG